jgi:hypothetical protein
LIGFELKVSKNPKGMTEMNFTRALSITTAALATLVCIFAFQNCTPFEAAFSELSSITTASVKSTSGGPELQPSTDRVDTQCLTSKTKYDACIFKKNPVAARGSALGGLSLTQPMNAYQTYGVKLTGLLDNGKLDNGTIHIESARGTNVSIFGANSIIESTGGNNLQLAATHIYYWLNRATEYIYLNTKELPAMDKGIRVVLDDSLSGFGANTNSIHLKADSRGSHLAWSAEVALHSFGAANLYHATNGQFLTTIDSAQHTKCNDTTDGCCTSFAGCAKAIESGVGDYFIGMIFPDQPTFGETVAGSMAGLRRCALDRSLNSSRTMTAVSAFNNCSAAPGDRVVMGQIYASIWWEVRSAASTKSAKTEVDTLFMKHLSRLDGRDTFASAMLKAKALDSQFFAGRNTNAINRQLSLRGI